MQNLKFKCYLLSFIVIIILLLLFIITFNNETNKISVLAGTYITQCPEEVMANITETVKSACETKATCSIMLPSSSINCPTQVSVEWGCQTSGLFRVNYVASTTTAALAIPQALEIKCPGRVFTPFTLAK